MTKEQTIASLAASFGMGDGRSTRFTESNYDASTGTLYCEGITIPKSAINKALEHFTRQKDYYKSIANLSDYNMDCYIVNVVACNAIMMLESNVKK